ncbi:carbamate kinase [Sporosalibacterium faouarense]|uniref:carbamate kinase n=1 Tax=Sporosalibacterium faouarense TaxID=516123 RepID=UPI00141D1241|nr:carbamate kinase [Sporosalibacterium faouarense]MTI47433.1 carbamate kinase [Bacillota bacterium]
MSRIMVALGGNALGKTPQEQLKLVKETAKSIVNLIEQGHEVIIAHGNGPQVGMINLAMEIASSTNETVSQMPFPECGAMSQGYIGYHMQNAIREELTKRSIDKSVATIITQVIVDENDEAFRKPSKPIGSFYSKEEAEKLINEKGYEMVEDSGRGYRRVVPSPKPVDIVEKDIVKVLVEKGQVVITVGGGGIPVVKQGSSLQGVPAVIDKDFASEKMAEIVDADYLFILTAVDRVAINFGKPNQIELKSISVEEAREYIDENQFAPGSMLPKVIAAIKFVESKQGRKAIIASLEKARQALLGESGTTIYKK